MLFVNDVSQSKEKDRSGLSKVTATANETNTQKERDFMSNSTFKPSDKVRDTVTGDPYTVVSSEDSLGYVAFTRDVPAVEHIRPQFIEPVSPAESPAVGDQVAFNDDQSETGVVTAPARLLMQVLWDGCASATPVSPTKVVVTRKASEGTGEPEHSEDELHARLIEWGASERTTVGQLLRLALDAEIDVKELFNAYASLGFIPNGGASNA